MTVTLYEIMKHCTKKRVTECMPTKHTKYPRVCGHAYYFFELFTIKIELLKVLPIKSLFFVQEIF